LEVQTPHASGFLSHDGGCFRNRFGLVLARLFHTTEHCDISIDKVELFQLDRNSPDENAELAKAKKEERRKSLSQQRNEPLEKRANQFPELKDFYNTYDPASVTEEQRKAFEKFKSELSEKDKEMLENSDSYYRISFKNVGGLIMPIVFIATFEDGSTKEVRLPAEIWRVDNSQCDNILISQSPIKSLELDPYRETADVNRDNNHFPPLIEPTRFQLFKQQRRNTEDNPMQRAKKAEEAKELKAKKEAEEKAKQQEATAGNEPKAKPTESKESSVDLPTAGPTEPNPDQPSSDTKSEKKKHKKDKKHKKRKPVDI
jgi:exonuclease VII large subunit